MEIIFIKPDKNRTEVIKTAIYSSDGTDGKIRYVSVTDDIDLKGEWQIKGKVTLSVPTGTWTTTKNTFTVEA